MNVSYLKWQRIEKMLLYEVLLNATPFKLQCTNIFLNHFKYWVDIINLLIFHLSHKEIMKTEDRLVTYYNM